MKWEVMIAGFGGQGVILAGYILGKSATIYDNKNAVLMRSYGPEARGGAASAELIISNEYIDSPIITGIDGIILMSQESANTHAHLISDNTIVLTEADIVSLKNPVKCRKHYSIPALRIAEGIGKKILANMVMLGSLNNVMRIVSPSALESAVRTSVPKGTEEMNIRALVEGYKSVEV